MSVELDPVNSYAELVSLMYFGGKQVTVEYFDKKSLKPLRRMWDETVGREARIAYDEEHEAICSIRHSVKIFVVDAKGGCWLEYMRRFRRSHLKYSSIRSKWIEDIKPWMISETAKKYPDRPNESEGPVRTALRAIKDEELKETLIDLGSPHVNPDEFRVLGGYMFPPEPRDSVVFYRVKSIVFPTMVLWRTSIDFPEEIVVRNDADVDVYIRYFPQIPSFILDQIQHLVPSGWLNQD